MHWHTQNSNDTTQLLRKDINYFGWCNITWPIIQKNLSLLKRMFICFYAECITESCWFLMHRLLRFIFLHKRYNWIWCTTSEAPPVMRLFKTSQSLWIVLCFQLLKYVCSENNYTCLLRFRFQLFLGNQWRNARRGKFQTKHNKLIVVIRNKKSSAEGGMGNK